ncbi:MAG: ribosome biogenesis GTPase Der, partial [Salinibacter sp.]|uniref:ribosome biogenesis GTPase Der n=1 Tax=Salinibacter sp. TaxID=2065818 RepID=UPI0035D4BF31
FNRLTGSRQAIVDDEPGVTRDRVYGEAEWEGHTIPLVDTGGYVPRSDDPYERAIREQAKIALEDADVILFVVDVTTGITEVDQEIANVLRTTETPVMVVANKADNEEREWAASEFYQLGLGEVHPMSSTTKRGMDDLMEALVDQLPEADTEEAGDRVRISLVGKPNVGKSSLVNATLGFDRAIVTETPGTTRDAVQSVVQYGPRELLLVDTAGMRKRSQAEDVEFYATVRSERAIEAGDVCVLVLDATEEVHRQDLRVLTTIAEHKKGMVVAVNKWDLVPDAENMMEQYTEYLHQYLDQFEHVPIVYVSAVTKERVYDLLDTALEVAEERERRISTSALNDALQAAIQEKHPPSSSSGAFVKIKYATQVRTAPPVFALFANHPEAVRTSYKRYLEGKIRDAFGFEGVPLTLAFREK